MSVFIDLSYNHEWWAARIFHKKTKQQQKGKRHTGKKKQVRHHQEYLSYITQITLIQRSLHWQSKTKSSFCNAISFNIYMEKTWTSLSFWMNFPKLDDLAHGFHWNVTKLSWIWNKLEKDNTLKRNRKRKTTQTNPQRQRGEQPQMLNVPWYCFQQTCIFCDKKQKWLHGCSRNEKKKVY